MFKSAHTKTYGRFGLHRWTKSRHVLLIILWISSCFVFLSRPTSSKKYHGPTSINKNTSFVKKTSILLIVLSICFLCFSIVGSSKSAAAATVYVDTDGTGNYNCDGTNDHIEINKALAYVNSVGGGTVYLKGPNTYWIDSTLVMGANTILEGDSNACIKLVANAGWATDVPMIKNIVGADNLIIRGFEIDGNSEAQSGISKGKGYYNMIYFEGASKAEVSNMRLEWGCGDGLKIRNSNNIKFLHNDVYKLGHDAFYALGCSNGEVAYNTVMTRTNGACRLSGGASAFTVHDNTFYSAISGGDSTGPAIEIDKTTVSSTSAFNDIEIYKNKIYTMNGAGIWMFAGYPDNVIRAKNVHIHDNTFTKVGQYVTNTGYSNAAIVIQNFDNTIIENNVFDDGGHAAIKWYAWAGHITTQSTTFTTYVRNNVIKNNDGSTSVSGSGVGIWNTDSTHSKFILQNNQFSNNKNGDTYGGGFTISGSTSTSTSTTDNPPVANAGADKTATTGSAVSFDSSASTDDKGIASYSWDFDSSNGITSEATTKTATKTYTTAGTYTVTLTVTDTSGQKSTDTVKVVVSTAVTNQIDNPPVANAGADKTATTGSAVSFDSSASTDDKGIASYSWDFDSSNGITSEATTKTATKTYTTAGTYTVTLTVTDTSGQKSSDTVKVVVGTTTTSTTTTGSVSYTPTYDNQLRESNPAGVASATNYIDVGKSTSRCRDVMLFDLSAYKTTDKITKATLSLYWYYPATKRSYDTVVEIYRPVEWDPKYVSWNSRMSGTLWGTAGGSWFDKSGVSQGSTPYASLTFPASTLPGNKYYEFDVTQLVQEYISGKNKNTGFFLKAKTENGNYIAFYSSDWSNAAQRPKLTVTI